MTDDATKNMKDWINDQASIDKNFMSTKLIKSKIPAIPKIEKDQQVKFAESKSHASLLINSIDHFYLVVKWLNIYVGHGKDSWTILGKVLKHFKKSEDPIYVHVCIFVDGFNNIAELISRSDNILIEEYKDKRKSIEFEKRLNRMADLDAILSEDTEWKAAFDAIPVTGNCDSDCGRIATHWFGNTSVATCNDSVCIQKQQDRYNKP